MRLRTHSSFLSLYISLYLIGLQISLASHCNVKYITFGLQKYKNYKVLNTVTRKYLNYHMSTHYYTYI